ncbi:MAG: hypothetical protein IKS24_04225 [Bacteroidaceae bacterium]|jgi:Acyl-ACP thioesterase|nr:hypothetical protein [Bacteroidaceae bacterium]
MEKCVRKIKVDSYDTDFRAEIKPHCLQNHLQEMAYIGSSMLGVGFNTLNPMKLFWAILRLHIRIDRMPKWGEELTFSTWHRKQSGPLYTRNFTVTSENTEMMVRASTVWTIMNIESRGVDRHLKLVNDSMAIDEDVFENDCIKLTIPHDINMEPRGEHRIVYSDIDVNRHANNAMYLSWVFDLFGMDYMSKHRLHDIQMQYAHEIHEGDTVSLLMGTNSEGIWFIRGNVGDINCFTARIEMEEALE